MIIFTHSPYTHRSHAGQHQRMKIELANRPPRLWFWREVLWVRMALKRLERRGRRRVQPWTWGTSWSQRLTGEEYNELVDVYGDRAWWLQR